MASPHPPLLSSRSSILSYMQYAIMFCLVYCSAQELRGHLPFRPRPPPRCKYYDMSSLSGLEQPVRMRSTYSLYTISRDFEHVPMKRKCRFVQANASDCYLPPSSGTYMQPRDSGTHSFFSKYMTSFQNSTWPSFHRPSIPPSLSPPKSMFSTVGPARKMAKLAQSGPFVSPPLPAVPILR